MKIQCVVMRGGTSRALFFHQQHLPDDLEQRAKIFMKAMGTPDVKQTDGLGGGLSSTSKVAVIAKSKRPDADVDYTFVQLGIDKPVVDYSGTCGNIAAAVGPFALEEGLVSAGGDTCSVRVYNTNTDSVYQADFESKDGMPVYEGSFAIDGLNVTGSPIYLKFTGIDGAVTGKLLPTGQTTEIMDLGSLGSFEVSLVDAASPYVFVDARTLGMTGAETPGQIEAAPGVMETLGVIRDEACLRAGMASSRERAGIDSAAFPKVVMVVPPADCQVSPERLIKAEEVNLIGRAISMERVHKSYPSTGAMCTAVAATIPGTVVNKAARLKGSADTITIGHPSGKIELAAKTSLDADGYPQVEYASFIRTARRIMSGIVYV